MTAMTRDLGDPNDAPLPQFLRFLCSSVFQGFVFSIPIRDHPRRSAVRVVFVLPDYVRFPAMTRDLGDSNDAPLPQFLRFLLSSVFQGLFFQFRSAIIRVDPR